MGERHFKIVILEESGTASVFPNSTVETEATVAQIIQDVKALRELTGEYELYVKVEDTAQKIGDLPEEITGIALLPADIKKKPAVELK